MVDEPFEISEYVNPVCLPKETWIPKDAECFFTGRHGYLLNHAIRTRVRGVCDYKNINDYTFCTRKVSAGNECLKKWAGALVCPDSTGVYYAVGVYHAEQANCEAGDGGIPSKFQSLVTPNQLKSIFDIINAHEYYPTKPQSTCDTHQCSTGECLTKEKMCDSVPDCPDFSDVSPEVKAKCGNKVAVCQNYNGTHCFCHENEFLCKNGMCLDKVKFCDDIDHCTDGSDEPYGCKTSCKVSLQVLHREKMCDGMVDCQSKDDLAEDEAASHCCNPNPVSYADRAAGFYPYR
jgi:hypothetical protein